MNIKDIIGLALLLALAYVVTDALSKVPGALKAATDTALPIHPPSDAVTRAAASMGLVPTAGPFTPDDFSRATSEAFNLSAPGDAIERALRAVGR